jgi:hypothetical protein
MKWTPMAAILGLSLPVSLPYSVSRIIIPLLQISCRCWDVRRCDAGRHTARFRCVMVVFALRCLSCAIPGLLRLILIPALSSLRQPSLHPPGSCRRRCLVPSPAPFPLRSISRCLWK